MKTIGMAAVLVALAAPAWAHCDKEQEEEAHRHKLRTWRHWVDLCRDAGGNAAICWMHHAPYETIAIDYAKTALKVCKGASTADWVADGLVIGCDEARAYIKKRWGY
jgi:hypothetical protein